MNGLFNTVSNYVESGVNTGNSIMANGDTTILAVGSYKCSDGTCANSYRMLITDDLNGEVKCVEDNASCVLDGENARRGMYVAGTGSGTLILRALTFDKGSGTAGGGVYIRDGAKVDLELCIFSNNRATSSSYGGGAIYIYASGTTVNIYGTRFNENTADTGNGDDIYRSSGTITIHNTCPSPYSSNIPIQGSALDTYGTVNGDEYSYSGCLGHPCVASSSHSDDGSDGNFYCINGGDVGGWWDEDGSFCTCTCTTGFGGPNCAICATGYSGSPPDVCSPDPCLATSTFTDDGSDGNFYCINGGDIGGTTGSCTCSSCNTGFYGINCQLTAHNVFNMNGLFNRVSNYDSDTFTGNTGNSIMLNGDTTILAVGPYKCSQGTCASSYSMLFTKDLNGEVKCVEDNASCVLDGENERRGINVQGTGSGTLILRALTFDKGYRDGNSGGGVYIRDGAIVDLELLVFSNNRATSSTYGGGAIFVSSSGGTVNAYGTSFSENTADSGNGDDIYNNGGTITIHNTCPSPYSSITPIQGSALDTYGTVGGSKHSFTDCFTPCVATTSPSDDGSDGNFYCINGGTIGGIAGSCTCTSCYDHVGGPNCATCVEGYSGDAPWCFLDCVASAYPSDDGSLESDGNFFCINGGTIGGSAGSCTCTSCLEGVGGPHCETCAEGYTGDAPWCFLNCVASAIPSDDGSLESDGNFYCMNGGTVGGIAGQCTCTSCNEGFDGPNCATCAEGYSANALACIRTCNATSDPADDGSLEKQGNFYCINEGTPLGTLLTWGKMGISTAPMVEQLEAQQAAAPAHSVTLGLLECTAMKLHLW
ncbi:hypothetical protein TrCOL_g6259 [Triparma columacea]|uniref:Laminin EGF-like domain-containing protein n=1 Tax=Triparma columacea TaxID=722753 RepID=A0A9W7G882_9STRA|nr:hypothetical protein TrCOL_g6259 [Triparma columacea]